MAEAKDESYYSILNNRINECLCLSIPEEERRKVVESWVARLIGVLEEDIKKDVQTEEDINSHFSHFVGKILSIIEGLNLNLKSQKAIRKLLLTEIYDLRDVIVNVFRKRNLNAEK